MAYELYLHKLFTSQRGKACLSKNKVEYLFLTKKEEADRIPRPQSPLCAFSITS